MARQASNKEDKQVRLSFQLFASDNALLVADLLNVRKGRLRHARLVTLATLGLMIERRAVGGEVAPALRLGEVRAAADCTSPLTRSLTIDDLELVDCMGKHGDPRDDHRTDSGKPGSR